MVKYRKKPVVIEAIQFVDYPGEMDGSEPAWYQAARTIDPGQPGSIAYRGTSGGGWLIISTLEGEMRADPGDWIIRGIKGELYPCKDEIFRATYEPAE